MIDIDILRKQIRKSFSKKRAEHIFGCEKTAALLAAKYGGDKYTVRLCALLHDITKEKNHEEQLKLCKEYGIILDNAELYVPELIHAVTGAHVALHIYGVGLREFDAIRYHTTGRANMTMLEKIIYISDSIEPERSYDGVDDIRKAAMKDLDEAMRLALDRSILFLIKKKKIIHTDTIGARNYLYEKRL